VRALCISCLLGWRVYCPQREILCVSGRMRDADSFGPCVYGCGSFGLAGIAGEQKAPASSFVYRCRHM